MQDLSGFASAGVMRSPVYSPTAADVITHWSGSLPKDAETGCEYVLIAVGWLTEWAEAEATLSASPKTAASFVYARIICRYGGILLFQSGNGSHFANDII